MENVASLAVDPQKGFTPLCPTQLPVPDGHNISTALNFMASFAKYMTASKDWHCEQALWIANDEHPQMSPLGLVDADKYWNSHCLGGTEGAEFLDGLPHVEDFDYVAYKGMEPQIHPYSACYHDLAGTRSTGLIEWYRQKGVDTVIVGGLSYEFCVRDTVMHLAGAGFRVFLYIPATRGIFPELINKASRDMLDAGVDLVESEDSLYQLFTK